MTKITIRISIVILKNKIITFQKTKWKTFGKYKVDLANIQIDDNYFENNKVISFTSSFIENGYQSEKTLDILCGSKASDHLRYSWESNSWKRTTTNSDESYMLRAICTKMNNNQRVFNFLESKGWEKYGNSSWVNTDGWRQWDGNNVDFYTNYYDPNHSKYSTVNTVSVNCRAKSISFLVSNPYGDNYWNNWVFTTGSL